MSSTPPPPPPPQEQPPQRGYGYAQGAANPFTGMTIPFNSEFLVFFIVEVIFFILWLASKYINADGFMTATAVVTVGYLISRGIAKASRVIEE